MGNTKIIWFEGTPLEESAGDWERDDIKRIGHAMGAAVHLSAPAPRRRVIGVVWTDSIPGGPELFDYVARRLESGRIALNDFDMPQFLFVHNNNDGRGWIPEHDIHPALSPPPDLLALIVTELQQWDRHGAPPDGTLRRIAELLGVPVRAAETPAGVSINVNVAEIGGQRVVALTLPAGEQSVAVALPPATAEALAKTLAQQARIARSPAGLILPPPT